MKLFRYNPHCSSQPTAHVMAENRLEADRALSNIRPDQLNYEGGPSDIEKRHKQAVHDMIHGLSDYTVEEFSVNEPSFTGSMLNE